MSDIEILKQFKMQIIAFLDELITQFPSEPDLVLARIFLKDQVEIKVVMDSLLYKLNQKINNGKTLKELIKNRDETILTQDQFFIELSKDKVNHFRKLWLSGTLDNDDKIIIWKWFDSFIYLSNKYSESQSQ